MVVNILLNQSDFSLLIRAIYSQSSDSMEPYFIAFHFISMNQKKEKRKKVFLPRWKSFHRYSHIIYLFASFIIISFEFKDSDRIGFESLTETFRIKDCSFCDVIRSNARSFLYYFHQTIKYFRYYIGIDIK